MNRERIEEQVTTMCQVVARNKKKNIPIKGLQIEKYAKLENHAHNIKFSDFIGDRGVNEPNKQLL